MAGVTVETSPEDAVVIVEVRELYRMLAPLRAAAFMDRLRAAGVTQADALRSAVHSAMTELERTAGAVMVRSGK